MPTRPEPPQPGPVCVLAAVTCIEGDPADGIAAGKRRFVTWDRALWWRTYREGGFDGYRTFRRRLSCGTLAVAVRRPDMTEEIRRLARGTS
jgi:hypothetical protein